MSNHKNELNRRDFMIDSAKKFLGVGLAPMTGASIATTSWGAVATPRRHARNVIVLNMTGGMTHLDTFNPRPEAGPEFKGKLEAIKTNADGLRLSPYLPKLAKHGDKLCIVSSMQTNQGAHEQGQYILHRSYAPRGTIVHPTLGAWVMKLSGKRNSSIPGFVAIGGGENAMSAGFLGSRYAGVPVRSPESGLENAARPSGVFPIDYMRRLRIANKMNEDFYSKFSHKRVKEHHGLYDEAISLMRSDDLTAFDISSEPDNVKEMYGGSRFGRGCLLARRLVEYGVRFVEVSKGGWDTHDDNFTRVEELAADLDNGFSALLEDLHRRGLLEETVVAVVTEFGRTPRINENDGRDHFPRAYSCVLAGGGVRGGQVYGKTNTEATKIIEGAAMPTNFNATIAKALGLPLDQVVHSPSGRPFWISDKAPALDVFG